MSEVIVDPFAKIKTDNSKQLEKTKSILELIKTKIPNITEPAIAITDADTIQLAWDKFTLYVDIDIHPDCKLEWYFTNREDRWTAAMRPRDTNELHESLVEKLMFFVKEEKVEIKTEEIKEEKVEIKEEVKEEVKVEENKEPAKMEINESK